MKTEKQAGHTPGPWREQGEFIIGADDTTICQARDEESWDSNARLIAAAPDFLAEVQELLSHAEYADGLATVPTQDMEALEALVARVLGQGDR